MLFEGDFGTEEDFKKAYGTDQPFGQFVRSIVGMDRGAAKEAFAHFLEKRNLKADQITFMNQIIEYLTQTGKLEPGQLFEVPFTDIHHEGLFGIFSIEESHGIRAIIESINGNSVVAS